MRKNAVRELMKMRERAFREIDKNPFIRHKISLLERLCGIRMSQAEYLKMRYDRNLMEIIDQHK